MFSQSPDVDVAQESPAAIQEHFSRILEGGTTPGRSRLGIQRQATLLPADFRPPPPALAPPALAAAQGATSFTPSFARAPVRAPSASAAEAFSGGYGSFNEDLYFPGASSKLDSDDMPLPVSLSEQVRDYLPMIFTMACILAFLNPIWLTASLGQDKTVQYFLGPWCRLAALLPIFFIVAHALFWIKRRPPRPVILMCVLLPTSFLMIVSNITFTRASMLADFLSGSDCTLPVEQQIEKSYKAARDLYQECLEETLRLAPADKNLTWSKASHLYRFQDCTEFNDTSSRSYQADWKYLKYMEEEYNCAGWCNESAPIWTHREVRGPCSVAAVQILDKKIVFRSRQIFTYSLGLAVCISILLVTRL
jgi:hypothetical protein